MRYLMGLINSINKKQAREQVVAVSSDNEDIQYKFLMVEAGVKCHSFLSTQKFDFTTHYLHPMEPDGNLLRVWCRGNALGNSVKDRSRLNHTIGDIGDPGFVDGTLDLGINPGGSGVKSTAIRFNRPQSDFQNEEYRHIGDSSDIRVSSVTTGHSEFMRYRPLDIDEQDGLSQTLWQKIDDNTPNDARMMQIRDTGRLLYIVKDGGVTTAKWTPEDTIVPGSNTSLPYDILPTYNASTKAMVIYVNGVSQTLTTFTGSVNWQDDLSPNHDLQLLRRGPGTDGGYCYGDLYDYRFYKEKIISSTEATRFYTNKWSISNIPFGQVAIVDHMATWTGSGGARGPGFTSTGFSSGFST